MSLLLAIAIWFLIRNYIDELNKEHLGWDGRRALGNPQDGEERPSLFRGGGGPHQNVPPPKAIPIQE